VTHPPCVTRIRVRPSLVGWHAKRHTAWAQRSYHASSSTGRPTPHTTTHHHTPPHHTIPYSEQVCCTWNPLTQSLGHSVTQSLSHSVTQSIIHLISHSVTHSLSHSLTHSLTYLDMKDHVRTLASSLSRS
jgi:hypothetical protein